mgnify:CR=1 FL=1
MPEPPDVGFVTRYVLENPWPLGGGLLLIGLVIGYLGLRDGRSDRMGVSLIAFLLGGAVIAASYAVTTAGEHGKAVTRDFVEAVADEDLVAATNLLSDDARLQLGSTTNATLDLDVIIGRLSWLTGRVDIIENDITMLKGFTEAEDRAVVHLKCWTDTDGYYNTPSEWVLIVEHQPDETWKISRITAISIAGETPRLSF